VNKKEKSVVFAQWWKKNKFQDIAKSIDAYKFVSAVPPQVGYVPSHNINFATMETTRVLTPVLVPDFYFLVMTFKSMDIRKESNESRDRKI
jgi:hypothetical protein